MCVLGTKCKHTFVIPTLNLFPKMSFNGELWNSFSKQSETFFFLATDTKIFIAFAVIEPSNVKCCECQFSVPFPKKKQKNKKQSKVKNTHSDATCPYMNVFIVFFH